MKRWLPVTGALLFGAWWFATTPPAHFRVAAPVHFDEATAQAILAVDHSAEFAASIRRFPSAIPGHDDIVFLSDGVSALATAMDGHLWKVDLATHAAEPYAKVPLMPAGLHEAPGDPEHAYFCASHFYGQAYPDSERVGLYRFDIARRVVTPVVQRVPDTVIGEPVVYADSDRSAPELERQDAAGSRPLAFCNDLEISEDGRRIYFSEPFSYAGASMGGGATREAVSLAGNGRLWRYDLDTGATRLVAQGFNFIDGVLYDLHPGLAREQSVIVSQTPRFKLTRFFLAGTKAGTYETVIDGLTGMADGLDRDRQGRIWCALLKERSGLLTWLHANPWIKPLFLRLPLERVPQSRRTGVLVLSPDGSTPLYSASYNGPLLSNIASAVPGPDGVYLTFFDRTQSGMALLPYPKELQ